jgi:L-iditol 2-dehydrogenase
MKTVIIEQEEKVIVEDISIPQLREDDVLIKVKMAGICGSDIHTYKGLHPFRKPPVAIGHEVSGEIVETGANIRHFSVGERVTVEPQLGCGTCDYCAKGHPNYCNNRRAPGVGEWLGTMAEYIVVPAASVLRLPPNTSHKLGVLTEPLAVGFHAAKKAQIHSDDKVAILGAGPIGLVTLVAVQEMGASQTLLTDVLEYPLTIAKQLGAAETLNITHFSDWPSEAVNIADGEFDKVLITAGVKGILNQALRMTKKGGKIITVAMFHEEEVINIEHLQGTEKEIIGCMTYTHEDFEDALRYLEKNGRPIENIISHILPYEEASRGFELVDEKAENSLKVLLEF